jgi:hypothetical protein
MGGMKWTSYMTLYILVTRQCNQFIFPIMIILFFLTTIIKNHPRPNRDSRNVLGTKACSSRPSHVLFWLESVNNERHLLNFAFFPNSESEFSKQLQSDLKESYLLPVNKRSGLIVRLTLAGV